MHTPAEVQRAIKNALIDLGSENGHHTFEHLCAALAREVVDPRIVPATGPVSAFGDDGRDGEAVGAEPGIVLACTTQRDGLRAKVQHDVGAICARGPAVGRVIVCTTSDVPEGLKHDLEDWAAVHHGVRLEVLDGSKIATQLASDDLFWIANTYLHVPALLGPAPYRQLADLLEAQLRTIGSARRQLRSADVHVPLIDRHVQRVPVDGVEATTASELPLLDLLREGGGRSVLITGEPGTGKTVAGQLLFEHLAAGWLDHRRADHAPILVRARDLLAHEPSFSEMLRRAACAVARPTAPIPAELFAARIAGASWLVIVDGLDEVQDADERRSLIELIADYGRPSNSYRFVVLARPVAPSELEPLAEGGFLMFSLPRFSTAELHEFTRRWFAGRPDGAALAAEFAAHDRDPYVVEMLRVPLFAGLALASAGSSPKLPGNRLDLIEAFLAGIRADPPDDLLALLAERVLDGEDGLLGAAMAWHRHRFPGRKITTDDLRRRLMSGGVLVPAGDDLAFAHQALAEYIAARHRAASMPPDGRAIPELVRNLKSRVRTNVSRYTVVLHLRSHPESTVQVVRSLLADRATKEQVRGGLLAAAGLILDGVPVPAELRDWTIRQLAGNAVSNDHAGESVDFLDVVSQFGGHPDVVKIFREIAISDNAPVHARCRAATHLALNGHPETAVSVLSLMVGAVPDAASAVAVHDALDDVGHGGHPESLDALRRWADDPGTDAFQLPRIAGRLHAHGESERAADLCRQVLDRPSARYFGHMEAAAALLVEIEGAGEAAGILERLRRLGGVQPYDKAKIAEVFAQAGAGTQAVALAREVLADPAAQTDDEALSGAIAAWVRARPPTSAQVMSVLRSGAREDLPQLYEEVAGHLARNGLPEAAMDLIDTLLSDPAARSSTLTYAAWHVARNASAEDAERTLLRIGKHPHGGARIVVDAAKFCRSAVPEQILPEALDLIADPASTAADAIAATSVLIANGAEWAARGVEAFARRPTATDQALATLANGLVDSGAGDVACGVALRILRSPVASAGDRNQACAVLLTASATGADQAVMAVRDNHWLSPADRLEVAAFLSDREHHVVALPLLLDVLPDPAATPEVVMAALSRLRPADSTLVAARLAPHATEPRMRKILAWLNAG